MGPAVLQIPAAVNRQRKFHLKWGIRTNELSIVPTGANLGLGCGNPQAIAELQPGEVVLDLGSGGGLDFL